MIDSMAKEYFNFLNKYLATFKGSDDESATIGDAKEEAVAAIIEFVKSSNLFQVLVYSCPCICNIDSMRKKFMIYNPQKDNFPLSCSLVPSCNIGCYSYIIYPNVFTVVCY